MKALSARQVAFYRENGYLVIENFLNKSELQVLNDELERLVAEKAGSLDRDDGDFNLEKKSGGIDGEAVGTGILRKIQEITKYSAFFESFVASEKMLDPIEDLIGPNIYYHSSKIMFKPARHGGIKPWHQDYAYWMSTEPEQVTSWLAIDDATLDNGCIELIPGSHRLGLIPHHSEELQISLDNIPQDKILKVPVSAGTIIYFHVLTLHFSGPNRTDRSRRSLITDYDPHARRVESKGFAGDKLLRSGGRKPTGQEV